MKSRGNTEVHAKVVLSARAPGEPRDPMLLMGLQVAWKVADDVVSLAPLQYCQVHPSRPDSCSKCIVPIQVSSGLWEPLPMSQDAL